MALESVTFFRGCLRNKEDVVELLSNVEKICFLSNQNVTQHTCRNLWYALTGNSVTRNIYSLQMPCCVRTLLRSRYKQRVCRDYITRHGALAIPDEYMINAGIPVDYMKEKNMFLVTACLGLRIRDLNSEDCIPKLNETTWQLPRILEEIYDTPLPNPPCFVELFLYEFKYVSEFDPMNEPKLFQISIMKDKMHSKKDPPPQKQTLFNYMIEKSPPSVQQMWANFKEAFELDGTSGKT